MHALARLCESPVQLPDELPLRQWLRAVSYEQLSMVVVQYALKELCSDDAVSLCSCHQNLSL